ncbi:MAG: hypothetical protein AB7G68_11885 [Nitrospiraceae bacterium]
MVNRMGRLLSAVVIGTISGFVLYFIPATVMDAASISPEFTAMLFLGGLIGTGVFVSRRAPTVRAVWGRGCLVGSVECLLVSVVLLYVPWLASAESGILDPGPSQLRDAMMWEAEMYSVAGFGLCFLLGAVLFALYIRTKRPMERHV